VQIDPGIELEDLAKVAHAFGEIVGLGLRNVAQCPVELNLVPFIVILMAVGLYAIALFSRLGKSVEQTVMGSYQSVMAVQTMERALGRMDEAMSEITVAQRLDPLSPPICFVAVLWYRSADRIEDAIHAGQRSVQLDPNYVYFDPPLADAYREKGDFNQAVALYEKAQAATHFPSPGLGITYGKMGRREDAHRILDQAEAHLVAVVADAASAVFEQAVQQLSGGDGARPARHA
jgi:tetratricopeptide (TPR) repeat protein